MPISGLITSVHSESSSYYLCCSLQTIQPSEIQSPPALLSLLPSTLKLGQDCLHCACHRSVSPSPRLNTCGGPHTVTPLKRKDVKLKKKKKNYQISNIVFETIMLQHIPKHKCTNLEQNLVSETTRISSL